MSLSRTLCVWLFVIIYIPVALAAELQARVNTTTVIEGDAFQLELSMDNDGAAPDFSPLEQDFQILGTSQSTQIKFINGDNSFVKSWVLTLTPKKTGQLTIPAITAGQLRSQEISVNVVDASKAPAAQGASQGVTITVRLNGQGDKFYQFQEIPLTVRIEIATATHNLSLLEPSSTQVELVQTAQDRHSQIVRNGQRIEVIERDYTLRPQQLGRISLPPFTLKGQVPDPNYRDPMDDFNRHFDSFFSGGGAFGQSPFSQMRGGKPFTKRSNSLDFSVSANPNAQSGEWFLPAKAVELEAQWQPENPTFRQGEAVTRIVRLQALGARAEQLPKLHFDSVDGAKIYVDDDQTAMKKTSQGTQALREVRLSIVPSRGGEVILPEVSVKWLNTETDETTTSVLPSTVIHVQGTKQNTGKGVGKGHTPQNTTQKNTTQQTKTTPTLNVGSDSKTTPETTWFQRWWLWLLLIVVGLCIAAVMGFIVKQRGVNATGSQLPLGAGGVDTRRQRASQKNATDAHTQKKQQRKQQSEHLMVIRRHLHQACKNADAKALYQALLQWQQAQTVAKQSAIIESLRTQLESSLFSPAAQEMASTDFAQIRKQIDREWKMLSNSSDEKYQGLPPLYESID